MERIRVDAGSSEMVEVELVRLRERHGEIERRLLELDRHLSLSPDEQLERARLKKEKLRNKDRMADRMAAQAAASHRQAEAQQAPDTGAAAPASG